MRTVLDQTTACLRDTPIAAVIFTSIGIVLALLLVAAGRGLF